MKLDFSRMRFRARSYAVEPAHGSMTMHTSTVSQSVAVPQATHVPSGSVPTKLDFASGAKAFKRQRLKSSLLRAFVVSCTITAVVFGLLAGVGLWLNHRYEGRALPYTFIGAVSVGGLNEAEIKQFLDTRSKEIVITLQDGGLTRQVSASELGITFDTAAAAREAMHGDMQLLSYLVRKSVEVPVQVNGRYVDGYLKLNIQNLQSRPVDAMIGVERGKLVLKPEQTGFMTDSTFVERALSSALAGMGDPVINVNAVTVKPRVYAAQLQDDFERAQAMLKPSVSFRISGVPYRITDKQKLQWLQIKSSTFDGSPQISFDRTAVRNYVISTVKKMPTVPDAKAVSYDIERATDQLMTALSSGSAAIVDVQSLQPQS